MSQRRVEPKMALVVKPAELLPWEREALAALRRLSAGGGRDMIISTCGFMAMREAEREPRAKRPAFRLVKGGQP